jgi:hypothetical protein
MSSAQKPTCFVIAPIGEKGSDTRKRSDKVLAHVFEAALGEKYAITRADKISEPGIITSQILRALQDSDLVLADLTEHNPNVFYELAVRHAVEKPVIHVTDPRWKIPFDVAGLRTITFDFTDLDSVAEAIKQIGDQAHEIQSGRWGETPIKLANITRRSKQDSDNIVLLKEAVEGIAALRASVDQLTGQISEQSSTFPNYYGLALNAPIDPMRQNQLANAANRYAEVFSTGTSEMLAAQDLLKYASQPDEVPPPPDRPRRRVLRSTSPTLRALRRKEEDKE